MTTRILKRHAGLLIATAVLFCSCSETPKPLTKAEAVAFAGEIENSIKKGDGNFLDNAFDKTEFIKKLDLPDNEEGRGFTSGIMTKLTLGSQLTAALNDQDNFNFIKYYEKEGRPHIIFRLFTNKDGSLNYHDYELVKSGDKCKIADAYIYMTGETLAETMHNMYYSIYKKMLKDDDGGSNSLAGLNDLKEVKDLLASGKAKEAKELYNTLPESLKKSKTVLLINVFICSRLTEEDYNTAIQEFKQKFPNEPNMSLMMIDGYYMQKDYEKMLGAVNALDSQINKDPLLDYHRYLSYNLLQKQDSSISCLKRLVKNMPDFQKGYIEYIATDLKKANNKEADSLISIYRSKPKFNQTELNTIITYYKQ
jgi:hypothetical protein